MHETMKKPRHKTPSWAKRARSASGAGEGDRQDHPSDCARNSSRRKTEAVLRLFLGDTILAQVRSSSERSGERCTPARRVRHASTAGTHCSATLGAKRPQRRRRRAVPASSSSAAALGAGTVDQRSVLIPTGFRSV